MRKIWERVRHILIAVGCLLSFFALVELLRVYNILHDFRPWAGYAYALTVLSAMVGGAVSWWVTFNKYPSIPRPPREVLTEKTKEQHVRFLIRYIKTLPENGVGKKGLMVSREHLRRGRNSVRFADITGVYDLLDDYVQVLRADAEREVRRCSRDVMLFVALSPWNSVDLLVVLYRNHKMISRIMALYKSRPSLRDQLKILMDLGSVVATVNFLGFGGKLASGLLSRVPVVGRYVDDIAQGFGASLFTSVMGHAAIDRIQSFRYWNEVEASKTISGHLKQYATDLSKVLTEDVLVRLKAGIKGVEISSGKDEAWETICSDVEGVIESTAEETTTDILKQENEFARISAGAATMVRSGRYLVGEHLKKVGNAVDETGRLLVTGLKKAESRVICPILI